MKNFKICGLSMICFSILAFSQPAKSVHAANSLAGRILLAVQSQGQAWYVNPIDSRRHYLGRPADAFNVMRQLGLGISNADFDNLNKIVPQRLAGRILIKTGDAGKAYYINPANLKLYYLGRPADAFNVMRQLGLGISNADLARIPAVTSTVITPPATASETDNIIANVAQAIRSNDSATVLKYFTSELQQPMAYTMNFYNDKPENRLILGNLFSSAALSSGNDQQKIYTAKAYFALGSKDWAVKITLTKQTDGKWLISNLLK